MGYPGGPVASQASWGAGDRGRSGNVAVEAELRMRCFENGQEAPGEERPGAQERRGRRGSSSPPQPPEDAEQ